MLNFLHIWVLSPNWYVLSIINSFPLIDIDSDWSIFSHWSANTMTDYIFPHWLIFSHEWIPGSIQWLINIFFTTGFIQYWLIFSHILICPTTDQHFLTYGFIQSLVNIFPSNGSVQLEYVPPNGSSLLNIFLLMDPIHLLILI